MGSTQAVCFVLFCTFLWCNGAFRTFSPSGACFKPNGPYWPPHGFLKGPRAGQHDLWLWVIPVGSIFYLHLYFFVCLFVCYLLFVMFFLLCLLPLLVSLFEIEDTWTPRPLPSVCLFVCLFLCLLCFFFFYVCLFVTLCVIFFFVYLFVTCTPRPLPIVYRLFLCLLCFSSLSFVFCLLLCVLYFSLFVSLFVCHLYCSTTSHSTSGISAPHRSNRSAWGKKSSLRVSSFCLPQRICIYVCSSSFLEFWG